MLILVKSCRGAGSIPVGDNSFVLGGAGDDLGQVSP